MRYRLIIAAEARQLPPLTPGWHEFGPLSLDELAEWCGGKTFTNDSGTYIAVPIFEGDKRAWPGDWIVKDVQGQFHKVAREDFEQGFVPVSADMHPEVAALYLAEAKALLADFRREDLAFINDTTGRAAMPQYSTWAARLATGLSNLIAILEKP